MKIDNSPKSNAFLNKVKVNRYHAYYEEDFEEISEYDDPDVGIIDGDKFNELNALIKKKASEDIQRIDIALIKGKTVVFLQDQWNDYGMFPVFETHCSIETFKKLLEGRKEMKPSPTFTVTQQINVYNSSEKDFPQKDFRKRGRKGWDWHISICPKGHIVQLRKSYTAKGAWGSVKCSKFCQKEKSK